MFWPRCRFQRKYSGGAWRGPPTSRLQPPSLHHNRSDPARPTPSWAGLLWGFLGFTYQRGWMGATCQHDWQAGLMLINFNGSCQGPPGAPINRHIHPWTQIRAFVSKKSVILLFWCFFFFFLITKRVWEVSLIDRRPWSWVLRFPACDTALQHISSNHPQKHSCGRLKPKQWKEEEIHLFSKTEVHKAAIVYRFHVRVLAGQNGWLCYANWAG